MPDESVKEILVSGENEGERLDVYLARLLADRYSRSRVKKLIEEGRIRIEGREVSAHYQIKEGQTINFADSPQEQTETRAENIPLDIIFEDDDILMVNKPVGLVVHPAHGNPRHTLVNGLLYHTQKLSKGGDPVRPGIVHRLDKDTSGIMVIAKNDPAHAFLGKQFKNHTIERAYFTVVKGVVQHDEGKCEEPVGRAFLSRKKVVIKPAGGKTAKTLFKVEKRFKDATLLKVMPKTGRTHQIRVHMAHMGYPILGDVFYGIKCPWINRQALHAKSLGFIHPRTKEKVSYDSELPEDMKFLIGKLEAE